MHSAAKRFRLANLTRHYLRHLFAKLCVEGVVGTPAVSRWFGHEDGAAPATKVYGHHRDQHSAAMAGLLNFAPTESNLVPLMEPEADPPERGRKARRA
jgi:integrase